MNCPECCAPCSREEVDVGVGTIASPWECSECGWSEDDGYPMLESDWQNKFNEELRVISK